MGRQFLPASADPALAVRPTGVHHRPLVEAAMYASLHASLHRQAKALELLCQLLEEEYGILLSRRADDVAGLEFSIQELIRQLAVEKVTVFFT